MPSLSRSVTSSRLIAQAGNETRMPSQAGIAIILVLFVVALCSIIVVNLAYSTQLFARLNGALSESVQAEYMLKSAVNLARVLIKEDDTPDDDSSKDQWGKFLNGVPIPNELLGLNQTQFRLEMEIRAEEAKIPLRPLVIRGTDQVETQWRDIIVRLFRSLGFDEDTEEVDQTGIFPGKWFSSEELVANLIDYMDANKEPYRGENFAEGIEGTSNKLDGVFPNTTLERLGELSTIPGFTPTRVRKLLPFTTTYGSSKVNINLAPDIVLKALSERIGDTEIASIRGFRDSEEGPFTQTALSPKLSSLIGDDLTQSISNRISAQSRWYQVIAKVESGSSTYFCRAYLAKGSQGELPSVRSLELF